MVKATYVTSTSVSVLDDSGPLNFRKAYVNSADGRAALLSDYPDGFENFPNGIIGDGLPWSLEPAVDDPAYPDAAAQTLSLDERVANLEETVDAMLTGGESE